MRRLLLRSRHLLLGKHACGLPFTHGLIGLAHVRRLMDWLDGHGRVLSSSCDGRDRGRHWREGRTNAQKPFRCCCAEFERPASPHPWSRSGPRPRPHSTSNWPIAVPISHDSYQLARSDSLGSTPFFQVLAGLLGKTAKSEARRPLASGDNYLNSASPVSSTLRAISSAISSGARRSAPARRNATFVA